MWNHLRNNWPLDFLILAILIVMLIKISGTTRSSSMAASLSGDSMWVAPSLYYEEMDGEQRALITYGQNLIANTSHYLGPEGSVAQITNGMNCQNCHLITGKKTWGNNYSAVFSTYPRFRDRSGSIETVYKRVSDCFERSLNGSAPDSISHEYKAIEAYILWLGKDVKKGVKPLGSGIAKIPFIDRAADTVKGKIIYMTQCAKCHGTEGEGLMGPVGGPHKYPPLWGPASYNDGAGLYRLSLFAGFVKSNMPFEEATHNKPTLSTEEAWDVAAYVNSQPRPKGNLSNDWPDISKKPFDHPFGPYSDGFTETQHKYGPFKPIIAKREEMTGITSTLHTQKK